MNSASHPGRLIVLEGPDGVGKTSLARALATTLKERGIHCEYASFPGQEEGTVGSLVYGIQHDAAASGVQHITSTSLQTLHIAAHIDTIETKILPRLKEGHWIVLDRFWWSTWVYGITSGVTRDSLEALVTLELLQWGDVKPDIIFVVERENESTQCPSSKLLKDQYLALVNREQHSYPVRILQNDGPLDETLGRLLTTLKTEIPEVSDQRFDAQYPLFEDSPVVMPTDEWGPYVFSALAPAEPTLVYDTFWRFAAERQEVFFRKLAGALPPWTDDPIIARYKFTNAYRASDRVSQYLIRRVIYGCDQSHDEIFFRTLLFKLFNKIETWELLQREAGPITLNCYSFDLYDDVLTRAISTNARIYSGAYIMPTGSKFFGHRAKHRNHLKLLQLMINDQVPDRVRDANSMKEVFERLLSYPSIGNFLAYQFATDLNYSEICDFSEMEFVSPGPGAIDGIHKCFSSLGGLSESDIIRMITDSQECEFERLGLEFRSLWGRPLQLIDCQNLFCEVSKYSRVMHPEIKGVSRRTRIKQQYRSSDAPLDFWYPPQWGINDLLPGASSDIYSA